MVFGNMGDDCATGVAFTRNPSTGEKRFFGEYLPNAQGEDVVAGIRTPLPISKAQKVGDETSLEEAMPQVYAQLENVYKKLEGGRLLGRGLPAGPGTAAGRVAFNAEHAVAMAKDGPVVLVRVETSPEDIAGMHSAVGILTTRGGLTSHAAVVARGMGRPCVVGAGSLRVDYNKGELRSEGHEPLEEGDWVSIDGTTGEVIGGKLDTRPSESIQVLVEGTMKPEQSEVFRNFD